MADSTWLVLSVVSNGCAPSGCQATGVTKIARSVIAPLAEHHVSVLMLSTYQTDFILVSSVGMAPCGPGAAWEVVGTPLSFGDSHGDAAPLPGAGAGPACGHSHLGRGVRHLQGGER